MSIRAYNIVTSIENGQIVKRVDNSFTFSFSYDNDLLEEILKHSEAWICSNGSIRTIEIDKEDMKQILNDNKELIDDDLEKRFNRLFNDVETDYIQWYCY